MNTTPHAAPTADEIDAATRAMSDHTIPSMLYACADIVAALAAEMRDAGNAAGEAEASAIRAMLEAVVDRAVRAQL